ncbi:MAG: glycosyltransferase family 2 protein [bacterium]|nr:glycosyltransferase family 2 protein [bacterium]
MHDRILDLSIIIVSWNVRDLLAACLRSIEATAGHLKLETIVVDSASSDDSVAMMQRDFPHVTVLAQHENVGYTRGNNIGLQAAKGRYLLLLNPDTEIMGDALTQMVAYLDAHPEVGVVGPHTLNTDGSYQSTRRRFPTVLLAFFESTWLQPYAPKTLLDRFYVNDAPQDATLEVDWVQGSALLARREIYDQIGGLDEGYVMFSEELDWCKRAKQHGWRVVYLGSANITHHGGKSTDQASARKHIYFQESKLRYFRKYHGVWVAVVLRVFLLLSYSLQLLLEAAKALIGSKRTMRQERIRTYWQVLRSGLKVS